MYVLSRYQFPYFLNTLYTCVYFNGISEHWRHDTETEAERDFPQCPFHLRDHYLFLFFFISLFYWQIAGSWSLDCIYVSHFTCQIVMRRELTFIEFLTVAKPHGWLAAFNIQIFNDQVVLFFFLQKWARYWGKITRVR